MTSPHGNGVWEQHDFSVHPVSVHLSRYLLLNHWAEFNQTYYMASPHGKGVQEQHYFPVCLVSVHPSVRHTVSSQTTGRNFS